MRTAAATLIGAALSFSFGFGLHVPPFFADILNSCHVVDKSSLDTCLSNALNYVRPHIPKGIPEWNVPVLEPLSIKSISFNQGGGNTKIRAQFDNLKVLGLSNYSVTYLKSYPKAYKVSVGLRFRKLHIEGDYNISGNLLLVPIKGQGPFWANFTSVRTDSYNYLDVVYPAGAMNPGRLHLARTQTDFNIGNVKLRLENLFNDEFLGQIVNNFLNENAHDIISEVKPQFAREIDRLVVKIFSEVFSSIPLDLWERIATSQSRRR